MADKEPSLAQQTFAKEYLSNGGNASAAAKVAYNTKHPDTVGAVAKRSNGVQSILKKYLEANNAGLQDAAAAVGNCLATQPESAPTHSERLKAAELVLKVHGLHSGSKATKNLHLHKHFSGMSIADMIARKTELESELDDD